MIGYFVIGLISGLLGETIGSIVIGISVLAILIPSIAIAIRRLHDTDRSGWWYLLSLIPIVESPREMLESAKLTCVDHANSAHDQNHAGAKCHQAAAWP